MSMTTRNIKCGPDEAVKRISSALFYTVPTSGWANLSPYDIMDIVKDGDRTMSKKTTVESLINSPGTPNAIRNIVDSLMSESTFALSHGDKKKTVSVSTCVFPSGVPVNITPSSLSTLARVYVVLPVPKKTLSNPKRTFDEVMMDAASDAPVFKPLDRKVKDTIVFTPCIPMPEIPSIPRDISQHYALVSNPKSSMAFNAKSEFEKSRPSRTIRRGRSVKEIPAVNPSERIVLVLEFS